MKKFLICVLAVVLAFAMVLPMASCNNTKEDPKESGTETSAETTDPTKDIVKFNGNYTYKDAVATLSGNWNPHTYQTTDESYPMDFLSVGLYSFFFNDALHPLEGKKAYEGYVIVPEMAASMPVDVTEQIKALEGNPYNIPEGATAGYAYTIDLNPLATWQNGEKINADTYVYSMKQLLDPKLANYRASDYMDGDFSIANAPNYFYQGSTSWMDNGVSNGYTLADLVKGEDGVYCTKDGNKMYVAVNFALEWTSGNTLKDYVEAYGEQYFGMTRWQELVGMMDENGLVPLTDDTNAMLAATTTTNENWGESDADLFNYYVERKDYADNYDFSKVGLFKSGDYQITLVLAKSLAGFNLLYNLSGNWIVYEPYYEANKTQTGDAWTTAYNTSVETTMSYGPYIMDSYQLDKAMHFVKNENWYGYTDGKHIYVDPEDGKTYPMYMTTAIDCQKVEEPSARKMLFLQGNLMTYGLQAEDFEEYRGSDRCYATPAETIFFFIFNGYMEAIQNRENNEGFDKTKQDLETLTLTSFRKAVAVTYNKEALCAAVSPSRSGGYGLIGNSYIYDPETGARYRDTDQAKKALCDFYSVDVSKFGGDLDKAVDSITGYDPETAKVLYKQAFAEALEKGYITSADGKTCDQEIKIEYASSAHSEFIEKTLNYLNEKLAEVLVGTPFEGKISFVESAPLGNEWSNNIRNGLSDTVLGGWSGSALNPFSIMDVYTNPSKQYDAKWFNAAAKDMTLTVNGEELTMSLQKWSLALNGETVEVNGKSYCFGDGVAPVETRLDILAGLESAILQTYDYIPMLQDASMFLLTKQLYYVVEEYNPIMGRGGIAYAKYNYDDTAWAKYVADEGGNLKY